MIRRALHEDLSMAHTHVPEQKKVADVGGMWVSTTISKVSHDTFRFKDDLKCARSGTRTHTAGNGQGILSPSCLPFHHSSACQCTAVPFVTASQR